MTLQFLNNDYEKERLVAAIENGTVIDHIPAEKTYQVVSLLGLEHTLSPVTIGYNYPSSRLGRKGIIKISNKFFTDEEINRLSVIASKIILNTIHNFEVTQKRMVETPDVLRGIIKCNNPKCITNNEPMSTIFHTTGEDKQILRCHYCDMEQNINEVELV